MSAANLAWTRRPLDPAEYHRLAARLARYTRRAGACLLWIGDRGRGGYGRVWVRGGSRQAHRVAYWLAGHRLAPTRDVLHRCDHRACVRPAHLFAARPALTIARKVARGRQARGEGHGRAKLSARQVLQARRFYRPRRRHVSALARRFQVCPTVMRRAILGETWKALSA